MTPALTAEEWAQVRTGFYDLRTMSQHAVAALHLGGQPYGFTHADVAMLRGAAGDYEGRGGFFETGRQLMALAERIEALLPPLDVKPSKEVF